MEDPTSTLLDSVTQRSWTWDQCESVTGYRFLRMMHDKCCQLRLPSRSPRSIKVTQWIAPKLPLMGPRASATGAFGAVSFSLIIARQRSRADGICYGIMPQSNILLAMGGAILLMKTARICGSPFNNPMARCSSALGGA
jgi:hypothetical protein